MQQNAANSAVNNTIFDDVKICLAKNEGTKRKRFFAQSFGRSSFI